MEFLGFDRIAFSHSLTASNYRYELNNRGYGLYGRAPENGGVLEIGFVEQNPIVLSGTYGDFLIEENGIFIIPPQCTMTVSAKNDGLHRHTSAEFLLSCKVSPAASFAPPAGKVITLPLYIPPAPENGEIFTHIRNIACAKTVQLERSYFEECADFMLLLQKLCRRVQSEGGMDAVSPGNRRHCNRAKTFISQNIDRRLSVGDVAEAVGVSKNYLTNVFSSSEGIPLMEYINRSKLSYMLELIRRYNYSLSEAGEHVGFTDVNYISRIFKRYYGMTVTEYKRSFEKRDDLTDL
jgi:AraC-like DNA-binding protein